MYEEQYQRDFSTINPSLIQKQKHLLNTSYLQAFQQGWANNSQDCS